MAQISVIVPVYKVEPYLRRCVDSILAQTFANLELILVDDGSPDNCGAICDEYAQKDSRVHVIHQANGGPSAARNAGIDWVFANSDSEWLNFVDSDDWVHPQMLERLYHAVLEHNVKVSVCGYEKTDGEIHWTNTDAVQARLWPVEQFYVEHNVNATVAWGKLYARACFADIRYPVGKIHEDEYVTYRILFQFEQVAVLDMPMYAYFVNLEGITKSNWTISGLDGLKAREEKIAFFREKGYEFAYIYQIREYAMVFVRIVEQILNQDEIEEKKKALRFVRCKFRRHLLKYHKEIPLITKNMWLYEAAFPRLMWIYWHLRAVGRKIHRE